MSTYLENLRPTSRLPRLGLVQRLRLVFILIVAVIGLAVVLALWQFKTLGEAQHQLVRISVPVMVRTQIVERALHDIIISAGQIASAPNQLALEEIEQKIFTQFVRARRSIEGLNWAHSHSATTDLILEGISEMEASVLRNLSTKTSLFETENELDRLNLKLTQQREEIRILIEQLGFVANQDMNTAVSAVSLAKPDELPTVSKQLKVVADRVSLIAQIALELETIANVAGQLGDNIPLEKLNDTKDFLAFRMRGVSQLLLRLPDIEERVELARKTVGFREQIFGDHGILANQNLLISRTQELALEYAAENILADEMTAATELLTASAHGQLTSSGQLTQMTTQRLILILALSAIAVAVIVVMTILVIVERQINQRIGLLAESVVRIASGDTEHDIEVSGHDELGRMAQSLEIFKRNARELLRSNDELEKFAYAAAHDLRSPLQAIRDLATWTIEDEDNQLSADSQENLTMLQSRVSRLSALLADLLRYARVGADIEDPVSVDLNTMVDETLSMLDPAGKFEITHHWDGQMIETYLHPLRKILLNLMSNTMKHHQSGGGKILVKSVFTGNRLHIEYSDDGPGIPPEYHEKVFELFQTLKPRDETEGSGLGLAITRKLIEHFDGSIGIKLDPISPKGTTFVFDFPATRESEIAHAA